MTMQRKDLRNSMAHEARAQNTDPRLRHAERLYPAV
jgi:hypothetical protein